MKLLPDKHPRPGLALAAAVLFAGLLPAAARAEDWKFSSSFNYNTGKYGTPDRTESVYVPFTLKRYYSRAAVSVTVPYLRQSSAGQVTWVDGSPVRVGKGKGAAVTPTPAGTSAESGLGDIMLRGTYTLKREGVKSFDLALAGRVKLPTADKNKGLGTGELDEGAGLEFAKEITPGWTVLADGYYSFIGDPDGVDLNDQVSLDIGCYRLLGDKLAMVLLYETQTALVDGNDAPRSASGTLSYSAANGAQFSGGLTLGLSDGSPDIAISAGFSRKF